MIRNWHFVCTRVCPSVGIATPFFQRKFFPAAHRKFARVPNLQIWRSATFDFLESVAQRIENRHGRMRPMVIPSQERFEAGRAELVAMVEEAEHFR